MIVPMMKYNFLLLSSGHEEFLNKLAELGIVDVTINNYTVDDQETSMISQINRYNTTIVAFNRFVDSAVGSEVKSSFYINPSSDEIADQFEQQSLLLEEIKAKKAALNELYQSNLLWGEFDSNVISELKSHGITLRFFVTSNRFFTSDFESKYPVEKVCENKGEVYFVYVQQQDDVFETLQNCKELSAPLENHTTIKLKIEDIDRLENEVLGRIVELKGYEETLKADIESLKDELHFYSIKNSNIRVAEGSLIFVEGWTPSDKSLIADSYFDTLSDVIVFKNKPKIDEEPPVLLKNNKFATSLELITKLYSLPRYNEVDMTPFLAPFFVFFVGMCIGDAGYGLILLIGSIVAKFSGKAAKFTQVINLVFWCSLATIFMGLLTGVFFGVELATLEALAPIKGLFIPTNDMFVFALAIGLVQILYAMILRAVIRMRRYGFVYGISGLGWVITIISSCAAMILPKVGIDGFTMSSLSYKIILGAAFVMMLFFQDPKKNIFMNFGIGLWELYNNVTGLLGDVLSYVRLFALGLSGGVIAGIFNKLAIGMSGDIPVVKYLIMILIILIGHSINMFMSVIGSFVHPLRLTFVEFYKNVGFEGGGRSYNPFFRRSDNKKNSDK